MPYEYWLKSYLTPDVGDAVPTRGICPPRHNVWGGVLAPDRPGDGCDDEGTQQTDDGCDAED